MMNLEEIKCNIDHLLADRGLTTEYKEQAVRLLLYHLYVAIDIYRYMSFSEKNKAGYWYRTFKSTYSMTGFLKERKRNREKENFPPHPLNKEKETEVKEKEQKTNERAESGVSSSLEERREAFRQECLKFCEKYDNEQVADFYHYWAEESMKTGKMLFEMEKSWNTAFRLARWSNNQYSSATTAAALRLEREKKKTATQTANTAEQQAIAAKREQDNAKLEQEIEERKAGAVSHEEYLRMKSTQKEPSLMCKNEEGRV